MGEDAGKGGKKGGRSRTQRKHFRQDRENVWKRPRNNTSSSTNKNDDAGSESSHSAWEPFATQNPDFNEYYKEQMIVSPEEWDTFMEVLRKPLPAAFRINSSGQFCLDLKYQLENDFMKSLQSEVADGCELQAIRPLPWYPDNLAWHSNFSRMQLRKNQTLERFHRFLKLENEIGNITRQEAVSMVPPLFLDVHPDHFVLDMCAAPGSKTFQLLEIIHQSTKPGSLPNGMVMANDLDVQRCNLLIHQTKRMCTANLVVTNNEAQHFPHCRPHKNNSGAVEVESQSRPWTSQLVFNRVLCDVPCSGDGTLRKAPDIWRKWSVGMGNGIHSLQIQIALRGASLLKVGGRMVYSTCSMNPVENEAVVAEILRKCDGSLQLVDVSSELPQLVRRPGLKKWKVRDKSVWLTSYKDVGEFRKNAIFPSMFPSGRNHMDSNNELEEKQENVENGNTEKLSLITENRATVLGGSDDEVCKFPLDRCMRIVPHDQNSGAFFIAVFHKVSPLPVIQVQQNTPQRDSCCHDDTSSLDLPSKHIEVADSMNVSKADESDGNVLDASETNLIEDGLDRDSLEYNTSKTPEEHNPEEAQGASEKKTDSNKTEGRRKLQLQGKWKGVDPVVFFQDKAVIDSIRAFYGIAKSFPLNGHLVTRNSDTNHVKRIYYISKSVKDVLELNFAVGQQLKITSVGLKIFERQTTKEGSVMPCSFRISSEGLPLILPYITKQILCASPADFKHLLQYKSIKFSDFLDAEFRQRASDLLQGCCVIVMGKDKACSSDSIQVDESTIAIGCWKGRASLNVMVTAIDCEELLERLSMRSEIEKESCMEVDNNHSNATAGNDELILDLVISLEKSRAKLGFLA